MLTQLFVAEHAPKRERLNLKLVFRDRPYEILELFPLFVHGGTGWHWKCRVGCQGRLGSPPSRPKFLAERMGIKHKSRIEPFDFVEDRLPLQGIAETFRTPPQCNPTSTGQGLPRSTTAVKTVIGFCPVAVPFDAVASRCRVKAL